jgi:hypothetical protein
VIKNWREWCFRKRKEPWIDQRTLDSRRPFIGEWKKDSSAGAICPFGVITFAADHCSKMNWSRCSGHKSAFALRNMMEEALKVWMTHVRA